MSNQDLIQKELTVPARLPDHTIMSMIQIAVEKDADINKLEKLMDLYERNQASLSKEAFSIAFAMWRKSTPVIPKNTQVKFPNKDGTITEYWHASLGDVAKAVDPLLAGAGLSYNWTMSQGNGGITVTCHLIHERGHSIEASMFSSPDASGGKNSIQQVASAVTYLQRYTLMSILGLTSCEIDDDARAAVVESKQDSLPEWYAKVKDLIEKASLSPAEVAKKAGVAHLKDVADARVPKLIEWLEGQVAKNNEQGAES